MHVKKGDEVLVIAGKDKGKRGKITQVLPLQSRVVVDGVNIIKRHTKARGAGRPGGIVEKEAPLHASNVMLICTNSRAHGSNGKAVRTGMRFLETEQDHKGRPLKVRYCKSCGERID